MQGLLLSLLFHPFSGSICWWRVCREGKERNPQIQKTHKPTNMSLGYAQKLSYKEDVGTVGMSEIFDPPHVLQEKVRPISLSRLSFFLCEFCFPFGQFSFKYAHSHSLTLWLQNPMWITWNTCFAGRKNLLFCSLSNYFWWVRGVSFCGWCINVLG